MTGAATQAEAVPTSGICVVVPGRSSGTNLRSPAKTCGKMLLSGFRGMQGRTAGQHFLLSFPRMFPEEHSKMML